MGGMAPPTMPPESQWAALAPAPDTIAWRRGSDARLLLAAGYALLLQVCHPTVGAGVREHSSYRRDPWGRLLHTLDYAYTMVYGGPQLAGEMGRRIRAEHRRIAGTMPDGSRYHALEPEAYAWVHTTLAEAIVAAHASFGRPLDEAERRRFWSEWRTMGRLLGIRERDLPAEWELFRAYFERMVEQRLERTAAAQDVLESLRDPPPPPVLARFPALWRVLRLPGCHALHLTSVGLLPAALRERLGVSWSRAQQRQWGALAAALRAATPVMPARLLNTGPAYMRWRRRSIAAAARAS